MRCDGYIYENSDMRLSDWIYNRQENKALKVLTLYLIVLEYDD